MRSFRCLSACLFGLCLLLAAQVLSAAPGQITYQGRLTNPQGQPILTRVTVTFSFWDSPTGGNKLGGFSDAKPVAPNKDGIYTTTVGTDANPIPTTVFERDRVWLNVNVNGEDLSPRQRITSSAYAVSSERTQTFTAAEAIKAGSFVMGTADGRIRKAQDPGGFNSIPFPNSAKLYPLGLNRVLASYGSATAVSIIAFDTSGTAAVTPVLTNTGFACSFNLPLDNGKYVLTSYNGTTQTLVAGALSGTQFSSGPALRYKANTVFALDTDKVVACDTTDYLYSTGTSMYVVAAKSDNTLQTVAWASPSYKKINACCPLGSGKFLNASYDKGSNTYGLAVGTISGITLQWGAWDPYAGSSPMLFQVDNGKAIFSYIGSNGNFCFQTVTASGMTAVRGPVLNVAYTYSGSMPQRISPYPVVRNKLCFLNGNQLTLLTVNGDKVESADLGRIASAAVAVDSVALTDNTHLAAAKTYSNPVWGAGVSFFPLSASDSVMDDWVGVAEQNVAAGQPCLVTVAGGITRMFGSLRPGRWYSLTQAGLRPTVWDTSVLRSYAGVKTLIVGKALGADKLLLSYNN